jgi:hypothetical protein
MTKLFASSASLLIAIAKMGFENNELESIFRDINDHLLQVQDSVKAWDKQTSDYFLSWWVAQLRESTSRAFKSGKLELEVWRKGMVRPMRWMFKVLY